VTASLPAMPEKDLQDAVVQLAKMLGYEAYHTHDSRRSAAGFPDLVLVHERSGALLFAELKRDGQRPTAAQHRWLRLLAIRGVAFVWHPQDLRDGSIARALQRYARGGAGDR
jgi:VRR-NUC domain